MNLQKNYHSALVSVWWIFFSFLSLAVAVTVEDYHYRYQQQIVEMILPADLEHPGVGELVYLTCAAQSVIAFDKEHS